MERENRYLVIKRKDLEGLETFAPKAWKGFEFILEVAEQRRVNRGKGPLCCVVVEQDWPEYELVWKLLEERIDKETSDETK